MTGREWTTGDACLIRKSRTGKWLCEKRERNSEMTSGPPEVEERASRWSDERPSTPRDGRRNKRAARRRHSSPDRQVLGVNSCGGEELEADAGGGRRRRRNSQPAGLGGYRRAPAGFDGQRDAHAGGHPCEPICSSTPGGILYCRHVLAMPSKAVRVAGVWWQGVWLWSRAATALAAGARSSAAPPRRPMRQAC